MVHECGRGLSHKPTPKVATEERICKELTVKPTYFFIPKARHCSNALSVALLLFFYFEVVEQQAQGIGGKEYLPQA